MDARDWETWEAFRGLWQGEHDGEPFVFGHEQQGVTTWFGTATERAFKMGRAHVVIQIDESLPWQRPRIFHIVGSALKSVPSVLLQRLPGPDVQHMRRWLERQRIYDKPADVQIPPVRLEFTHAAESGSARARSDTVGRLGDGFVRSYSVTVTPDRWLDDAHSPKPTLAIGFERMLIHELAHILDYYQRDARTGADADTATLWSDTDAWQNAIAQSPCAVNEYATTNTREDFAESAVAWFAYFGGRQGRLDDAYRDALRERLGARYDVLNRLMHDRF